MNHSLLFLEAIKLLFKIVMRTAPFWLLLSCKSTNSLPNGVLYDCDFYPERYFPDSSKLEYEKISDVLGWIHRRIAGGLREDIGRSFGKQIEKDRWNKNQPSEIGSKTLRKIWLIPSEVTNDWNPMNVIFERRGDRYLLMRVEDQHRAAFRFSKSPKGVEQDIVLMRIGYCNI